MTTIAAPISATSHSDAWLNALRASGPAYDQAVDSLYALLLRGARFELTRRRASARGEELDDLATQAADDALVAVLAKLDDFRGASRFTTWAYKFALLEAGVRRRRRAWQGRELPLEPESWSVIADGDPTPDQEVETKEFLTALQRAVASDLSPHQRKVLVAVTLNGVPIDVLAERLDTTRGALYKTIHDARRKLRAALAARELGVKGHMETTTS
jgi:RNA polymerase sigma-70 factor, ECF subfamily